MSNVASSSLPCTNVWMLRTPKRLEVATMRKQVLLHLGSVHYDTACMQLRASHVQPLPFFSDL